MTAAQLHHGRRRFYPSARVCVILVICLVPVLTCQDPGTVAHSHRVLTGSRFTVGSTVQFICNKGYVLSGNSLLTCYNRDSAAPKWSERLPKCVRKSTSAWKRRSHGAVCRFWPRSGRWQCLWPFQLRSTSRAGTLAPPPPACRTPRRPFTKQGRCWPSPVTLATSCRERPPFTVSLGTLRSGITPPLPAEVRARPSYAFHFRFRFYHSLHYYSSISVSSSQKVNERKLDGKTRLTITAQKKEVLLTGCAYFRDVFCVFRLVVLNMDYSLEGTNAALAVLIPTVVILVVVLGIYVYFAK